MPNSSSQTGGLLNLEPVQLDLVVRFAIAVGFGLLLVISYTRAVHWDEFYFLSRVYDYVEGRLDRPLQTFFVHGFTWLTLLPTDELGQIFIARLVMVGFVGLTAMSLHRIAAHFTDLFSANIAVLAFLVSGFLLPHGASFRADPMAAAFLTATVALMLTTQMKLAQAGIVAVLSALAFLISIKAVLYAPAFLAVLLWRRNDRGVVLHIVLAGVSALVLIGLLHTWHANGIGVALGQDTATVTRNAANTVLLQPGLFPRLSFILTWAILSVPLLVLALIGLITSKNVKTVVFLLLLASPLLSVVFYRNAFPYFFPFAVPLVTTAVALGANALQGKRLLSLLIAASIVLGLGQGAISFREGTQTQRATMNEVHRLFPKPVPYIDAYRMMVSFPGYGPFMSGWGMSNYRANGQAVFAGLITMHEPPLLIANKGNLFSAMRQKGSGVMLPADDEALHETYVHYNGVIWLLGRSVTLTHAEQRMTVPIAGNYRVHTLAEIEVAGNRLADGDVLALDGETVINGTVGDQVKFIWDTGVPPLEEALPVSGINSRFLTFF